MDRPRAARIAVGLFCLSVYRAEAFQQELIHRMLLLPRRHALPGSGHPHGLTAPAQERRERFG
jgi:hypothetical protein